VTVLSVVGVDEGQQRQMTRAFDLTRKAALAAGAVARLAARANLTRLIDKFAERVHVLIIEAFAFRAVFGIFLAAAVAPPSAIITT
jgi:hypothetical protein